MNDHLNTPSPRVIYTISRLNQEMRALLEGEFPLLWIVGEVSNLSRPSSGHLYFSLKDARAQIRCVLFHQRAFLFRDCPHNGQQVLVHGRVSLYEARGDAQLLVDYLEEAGTGARHQAYDELRRRLEQEGLFTPDHKQPLPRFPQTIGVMTSPTGAAIRDVLTTLRRRCPHVPVLLYPVPVQGETAVPQIIQMLRRASQRRDCDVMLLVRGGGSQDDLWAFNDEGVVRAMVDCAIPLVTGIGHETDITLADFAADVRAPTPTAAAELVSLDRLEWLRHLRAWDQRLERALQGRLAQPLLRLEALSGRLLQHSPQRSLREQAQRLDDADQRLQQALRNRLAQQRLILAESVARLQAQTPRSQLQRMHHQLHTWAWRLNAAIRQRLQAASQQIHRLSHPLHTLSPLTTLNRGYALVRRSSDGVIVRCAQELSIGDTVETVLSQGRLQCEVKAIFPHE